MHSVLDLDYVHIMMMLCISKTLITALSAPNWHYKLLIGVLIGLPIGFQVPKRLLIGILIELKFLFGAYLFLSLIV